MAAFSEKELRLTASQAEAVDEAAFVVRLCRVAFFGAELFLAGAVAAALFSAHRFFAASEILFRPSALMRLLAGFLPTLVAPPATAAPGAAFTSRNAAMARSIVAR